MRFASTIRLLAVLVLVLFTAPHALASNGPGDSPSLCCPSDLDGDAVVGSSDLADILAAWGPARAGDTADLDDSGEVDAIDIAILIGSWGVCPAPCLKTLVIGSVQLADGTPVADAVVVTELGGQGVSDEAGAFSFDVEVSVESQSLTVTAIASLRGATFTGTKLVWPVILGGITDAGVISLSPSTGCAGEFGWLPGFGLPGLDGPAYAMTVFDDGTGPALYVGGNFASAGGVAANNIARWDGSEWSSLGFGESNGVNAWVFALTVFDDGNGPALYAGGNFTAAGEVPAQGIASWNGTSWSSLGSGPTSGLNGTVLALSASDVGPGKGSSLYVGGMFTMAGGVAAARIARWDGSSWSALGTGATNGVNGTVWALAQFDDGSGAGSALVAGGEFTTADGIVANRVARWDGSSWSSLGVGPANGVTSRVFALTVVEEGSGSGSVLIAGGDFIFAGGISAHRIARWDGSSWSSLGHGTANGTNGRVSALAVLEGGAGDGPALYVGGEFGTAGGVVAKHVARWDGSAWTSLGTEAENGVTGSVFALATFDDGSSAGPLVHVAGGLKAAGELPAGKIARWSGRSWSLLSAGPTHGADDVILALAVLDDGLGGGPALYAGGHFETIGGVEAHHIARWDGASWSALGSGPANGVNGGVNSLVVFDDGLGDGPALYAAGSFTEAGGVPAHRIARWRAGSWSSLGIGPENGVSGPINALAVWSNGLEAAPELFVGGAFASAGGVPAHHVARWNGSSWASLGTEGANGVDSDVRAFASFDDGSGRGPSLFVGGEFTVAGGVPSSRIARWNGRSWSPLLAGSINGLDDSVHALAVFDDGAGQGPALYAGGVFATAGGVEAHRIARWDGSMWSALGSGPTNGLNGLVSAMTVFDDGSGGGPRLYVGGQFTFAYPLAATRVVRWDGTSWSPLGAGVSGGLVSWVSSLAAFDDGSAGGPALIVGGNFTTAGDLPASNVAVWGCSTSRGE